jgi:hypothetical protein
MAVSNAEEVVSSYTVNVLTGAESEKTREMETSDLEVDENTASTKKDWRFWSIIASLSVVAILAAIDGTIITTALPSITDTLSGGNKYVWVIGAYFLSWYAPLPLSPPDSVLMCS